MESVHWAVRGEVKCVGRDSPLCSNSMITFFVIIDSPTLLLKYILHLFFCENKFS